MAWTQTQVDALKAAIASGTRTVSYGDKTVTYQDTTAMLAALQAMEAEVAASGGADTSVGRCTFATYGRGLDG